MADTRYTVLGQAAHYQEAINRPRGGGPREPFRSIAEARALLLPEIDRLRETAAVIPAEQRLSEIVIEIQLDWRYTSKTSQPNALLKRADLHVRGSGLWNQRISGEGNRQSAGEDLSDSTALYVSGTDDSLIKLHSLIDYPDTQSLGNDLIGIQHIRLPTFADRLTREAAERKDERFAVEIVLYAWGPLQRDDAVDRVSKAIRQDMGDDATILVRPYVSGPTFIAATITRRLLRRLGDYNFLRLTRSLPRVTLTRSSIGMSLGAPALPTVVTDPVTTIAVFDGGSEPLPHLAPYVQTSDETPRPAQAALLEHGTAVVGAAVYGHLEPGKPLPPAQCHVLSYRILPDPFGSDIELYGVIDTLERLVPRLPRDVKVLNLSIGPVGPIDHSPSRFTYAIDLLSYENDKLFITAVGNDRGKPGCERLQSPSDAVNNVAVGAFSHDPATGAKIPADYSCEGPGRAGCLRKPDIVAFGGSAAVPFYALDRTPGAMTGVFGTSYAAPVTSALCGNLLSRVTTGLSTQAGRALLIHTAEPFEAANERIGWGAVVPTPEHALVCTPTRVTVLYEGLLSPRRSWKLPFLAPPGFAGGGMVHFSWTIAYCPDVDQHKPNDYTLAGIELQMRPHAERFNMWRRDTTKREGPFHIREDAAQIARLKAAGWQLSRLPATSPTKQLTEMQLRADEAKWDTIVRGTVSKRAVGLMDPMLTISIVGRGSWDEEDPTIQARFGAALTIDAPKYHGDLYADVMQAWVKLKPLTLRAQSNLRLRT